jgi:hypothetical protein
MLNFPGCFAFTFTIPPCSQTQSSEASAGDYLE